MKSIDYIEIRIFPLGIEDNSVILKWLRRESNRCLKKRRREKDK